MNRCGPRSRLYMTGKAFFAARRSFSGDKYQLERPGKLGKFPFFFVADPDRRSSVCGRRTSRIRLLVNLARTLLSELHLRDVIRGGGPFVSGPALCFFWRICASAKTASQYFA